MGVSKMDVKAKIRELVEKLKGNNKLKERFKADPFLLSTMNSNFKVL